MNAIYQVKISPPQKVELKCINGEPCGVILSLICKNDPNPVLKSNGIWNRAPLTWQTGSFEFHITNYLNFSIFGHLVTRLFSNVLSIRVT